MSTCSSGTVSSSAQWIENPFPRAVHRGGTSGFRILYSFDLVVRNSVPGAIFASEWVQRRVEGGQSVESGGSEKIELMRPI